jgi:hypothetical protein
MIGRQVLRTEATRVQDPDKTRIGQHKEGVMRMFRWILIAMLVVLPFAAVSAANAQVAVGVGVGPAVVAAPAYYGPPACSWGYYPYYPYACAPYGYYGPSWFVGGLFIGAGPWYHWGWYGHPGWGYGYRGGYGSRGGYGYAGRGYVGGGVAHGYAGGGVARGYAGGVAHGYSGGAVAHGGFSGGGFHGGGGGGFHGGGGGGHR